MRSTRRPPNRLERTLVLVLAGFIAVNLLLIVPAFASEVRLDRLHPSLPIVNLRPLAAGRARITDGLGEDFTAPVRALAAELQQAGVKVFSAVLPVEDSAPSDPSEPSQTATSNQNDGGNAMVKAFLPTHTPSAPSITKSPAANSTHMSSYTPTSTPVPSQHDPSMTPSQVAVLTATVVHTAVQTASPTPVWQYSPVPTIGLTDTHVSTPSSTPTPTNTEIPALTPTLFLPPPTSSVSTGMYYLAPDGNDSNPGTIDLPWQTLQAIHSRDFLPGDVILFKRGGSWSGGLVINDSGTQGKPITFTAYGTGNRPIIANPGEPGSYISVVEINADWVVVEDLLVQEAHLAGVYIAEGADHNVVRDIEATNVGIGIAIHGQYNVASRNNVHDLHMVVNTQGGNEDYGAVGIWLFNSNNEVSHNRMANCIAPSYDFGTDGGALAWWGAANNNYVHHNWAVGCHGFFEIAGGSAKNTVISYNVSINNGFFGTIHLGGTFASDVENIRIENNTIVETVTDDQDWMVLGFVTGDPTEGTVFVRNNIFWIEKGSGRDGGLQGVSNKSSFTHVYNVYHLIGVPLGFDLAQGEKIANPRFSDLEGRDFRLQSGSPAIDSGIGLGHLSDFDDNLVPSGAGPDIGAFEYQP